jgi:caa(3)-type oxidase subunit IV
MADIAEKTLEAPVVAHQAAEEHPAHKTPNYIMIFVWLIVITGAEVAVGYIPHAVLATAITYPILLVMSLAKVILVALYFMHLRYDNRWFLTIMLAAIPFVVLFILALTLGFQRN